MDYMRLLFLLTVAPAIVIFYIIIRQDQEKDKDKGFLFGVFMMGVLSVVPALILESLWDMILPDMESSIAGMLFEFFVTVGISEELSKYFAMRVVTWKNYRFNSTYDGVVYGVCSALGFATLENFTYVFTSGSSAFGTAITRAFMAVPFHAMCGIIWGYGYGISKYRSVNNQPHVHQPVIIGLVIAVLYHGLYDFSLTAFGDAGFAIAIVLVLAGYVIVFGKAKRAARDDELFYTYMPPFRQDIEYRPYVPFYGKMQFPVNFQVTNPNLNPGGYYPIFRMPGYNSGYQNNYGYQNQQVQNSYNPGYQNRPNQYQSNVVSPNSYGYQNNAVYLNRPNQQYYAGNYNNAGYQNNPGYQNPQQINSGYQNRPALPQQNNFQQQNNIQLQQNHNVSSSGDTWDNYRNQYENKNEQ